LALKAFNRSILSGAVYGIDLDGLKEKARQGEELAQPRPLEKGD
jgi:hypothetical protein